MTSLTSVPIDDKTLVYLTRRHASVNLCPRQNEGVMGWVAEDVARRLRSSLGTYHWYEWDACCDALGLQCVIVPRQLDTPALLINNTVVVRAGFTSKETAWLFWHEIGHAVMDPGGSSWWYQQPGGVHNVNKFERRADEFAKTFPIWN